MQKIATDNDITFDDNPLDASEGQHSINRRSFDAQADDMPNTDEHWLWSHVHRVKRDLFDWDWSFAPKDIDSSSERSTTATVTAEEASEEAPHAEEVEQSDFSATEEDIGNESDEEDDDEDIENFIEGSGTPKSAQIPVDVPDTKLERFCENCKFTTKGEKTKIY